MSTTLDIAGDICVALRNYRHMMGDKCNVDDIGFPKSELLIVNTISTMRVADTSGRSYEITVTEITEGESA